MASSTAAPGMPARLFPVITIMVFLVMMDSRVMTAMLPDIARDLNSTIEATGIAITMYLIAYGVFQLAYGPIADRIGPVKVMSAAAIVLAAILGFTVFVTSMPALVGLRLIAGAVAAAFFPLALATVGRLVPYEQRQQTIGSLLAAVALGQILGAALGGFVTEWISWRAMFALNAVITVGMVAFLWQLRGSVGGTAPSGAMFAAHLRILRNSRAMWISLVVLLEGAAIFGGGAYIGALLNDGFGVSLVTVGLVLMLEGAAIFLTSRNLKRILPKLGENRAIAVGAAMMAVGFLLPWMFTTWVSVIPGVLLIGAGFSICHSTLQTRATTVDPEAQGTMISIFAFSLFLGGAVGTAAFGWILAAFDYSALLLGSGVVLMVVAIIAPRLTEATPQEPTSTAASS